MLTITTLQLFSVSIAIINRELIHTITADRNQWLQSYDYIVIGSGAAGSVVARRLSEARDAMVLLLEAGPQQSVLNDIPGSGESVLGLMGAQYDWNYTLVTQNTIGVAYNSQTERSGRVLGGSASVNAMIYNRGNKHGYDNWVQSYGAFGWSYREVLPYFIKSENNSDKTLVKNNPGYHGTNGQLGISSEFVYEPILVKLVNILSARGVPVVDINGANQTGQAIVQSFITDKRLRSSPANSYIDPNHFPERLHILTNAFVTKILFTKTKSKPIANGIQFYRNNTYFTVNATKEVIICAGAIRSPQLLMLSGIGPRSDLEQLGIPVLVDLPVGKNYQNHCGVRNMFIVRNNSQVLPARELTEEQLYQFLIKHTGPLAWNNFHYHYHSTGSYGKESDDWPNTSLTSSLTKYDNNITNSVSVYSLDINEWKSYYKQFINKNIFGVLSAIIRIRSYGSIQLSSTVPFKQPLIDPKFLSNPQDLEDLISVTKLAHFMVEMTPLSKYVYIPDQPIPGCHYCTDRPQYLCDDYIRCIIKQMGTSVTHSASTCRMGAVNRPDVVVDPRLRVKNVSGLRVICAAVMPKLVNSNTWAVTDMIGEKGSQMVLQDNK